ncbi:YbjN domain-containing protein [Ferrimonas balearica]|uniref:YbjN domain-containing protein n=1 Tax=Ferrimonas balearica TaxID=44012 RepID=UPI001C984E8F|nr:YbjN domain-containing protein [Ferrimonas balearica]MBY6107138.1 YbjN domain-containing protein [Ferrimonas balearica]
MKRLRPLLGLAAALTLAGCASTEADTAASPAANTNAEPVVLETGAQALVDGTEPEAILELARGYGSAELETDSEGDPMITGRINGTQYVVYFYGCEAGQSCREVQFVAAWAGTDMDMEGVNRWNEETRYGKAYIDHEGDPVLEFTVNLYKGVTRANLDDTIDWWKVAMTAFEERF